MSGKIVQLMGQVLGRVLKDGKTVTTVTRSGKTFTSVFDKSGNLLKTRIKSFQHHAPTNTIRRYTTQVDHGLNTVTNTTAVRNYNLVGKYKGSGVTRVSQQMNDGNLLTSETGFIKPGGQYISSTYKSTSVDFSNVMNHLG